MGGDGMWPPGQGEHREWTPSSAPGPGAAPEASAFEAEELSVRPFLLTGGRTRPARDDLRVESLIQSQNGVAAATLRFEARTIYDLCRRTSSIADIAAALRVPLGVTRILVSDLIATGYVALVQDQALSVGMLERIRDRVRAL